MEGFNRDRGSGGGRSFGGNRGGFGGRRGFNDGPREMHKATCSECGKECEVPFKPAEGKPVYCRECYFKRKNASDGSGVAPAQETKPKPVAEEVASEEVEVEDDFEEEAE